MITVLGGAGFIGSHIVDELMTQGFEVRVIDNLSEGKVENLATWFGNPKFDFVRGDITNFDLVRRAVDGATCVFHLAAMSRIQPSITNPLSAFSTNFMGTANVAEACKQAGVKRVVYSASSSAYGRINDWAVNDGKGLYETLPTECLNPYSLAKKGGEEILELYRQLYGLSTVSLRYFNVYGPRHQETGSYATVIAIWRKQMRFKQDLTIVGDGNQRRDFTFVSDVVRANMLAMMNREAVGTINIGSGRNYSINELAELVAPNHPTVNIPPRLGEANKTLACVDKAKEILGWEPQINLQTGLELLDMYEKKFGTTGLIQSL